jgi:hypothetical protein
MISDVLELNRVVEKVSKRMKEEERQQESKKDFVIFTSNKDAKNKKVELEPFSVLKNAVLLSY